MTHRRNYEREETTDSDRYYDRNRTVKGATGDYKDDWDRTERRSDAYKTSEDNPEEEKYCDCSCHKGRTGGRKSSGGRTNKGRTGGRKSSGGRTNKGRTGGRKSSGNRTNKGRTGGRKSSGNRTNKGRSDRRKSSGSRTNRGRSDRRCCCWCCRCRSYRR